MIAPPGAGKGTQGVVIAEHFGIPHIATGDLLRDHVARGTELEVGAGRARRWRARARRGRARHGPHRHGGAQGDGYVLDGVPRTMEQARALYEIGVELCMTADVALHLQVEDDEPSRRLLARAEGGGPTTPRTSSASGWPSTTT